VLDARVYRTAFLPALIALFVAAFSLADRPAAVPASLAPDAFDGARAFSLLAHLGVAFPARAAGSPGDDALASDVARRLRAGGYQVSRASIEGRTATGRRELVTVVGVRPGLSSRRIVVLAHRDAVDRPGLAALSGTAALLELARVLEARDLTKTLVLVSTSGATTGFAGARAWAGAAAGGPVDGVLVLGDLAGEQARRPWVVPWPDSAGAPPLRLQRTVEAAVRAEVDARAGASRAGGQWARRALPATTTGQGPVGAAGIPAVLLSVSGERGPGAGKRVLRGRMGAFGRAALRAVSAMDAAGPGPGGGPAFAGGGLVTMRNVLPDWAVRMVVGTLLLPALLAGLDAVFRARRRRLPMGRWFAWLGVAALPLPAAWLWARLLGFTGLLHAPGGMVRPDAFPLTARGAVAIGSVLVAAGVAWLAGRRVTASRRPPRGSAAAGGLSAATGLVATGTAALTWAANPYAAALLLPAAHIWLFASAPGRRPRRWVAAAAIGAGLAAPLLVVAHLALVLGLGPAALAWAFLLAAAGGGAALGTTLWTAGLLAALVGLLTVLRARSRIEAAVGDEGLTIRTRGPLTYAGPGSLGGTESALRK
jgi:hypothetical protein